MVEELLPAAIAFGAEMDVDKRIAFRFYGQFYQGHTRLFRQPAAFSDIATGAGTNDIFPGSFAAETSRYDVVERQFACVEFFAAILAGVSVACENIPAIEFHLVSGQAVIKKKPDNFRNGDVEIHG